MSLSKNVQPDAIRARRNTGSCVCTQCRKKYACKSTLNRHVRDMHGEIKPFLCGLCLLSFSQYSNCLAHAQSHTKPNFRSRNHLFACNKCGVRWQQQPESHRCAPTCTLVFPGGTEATFPSPISLPTTVNVTQDPNMGANNFLLESPPPSIVEPLSDSLPPSFKLPQTPLVSLSPVLGDQRFTWSENALAHVAFDQQQELLAPVEIQPIVSSEDSDQGQAEKRQKIEHPIPLIDEDTQNVPPVANTLQVDLPYVDEASQTIQWKGVSSALVAPRKRKREGTSIEIQRNDPTADNQQQVFDSPRSGNLGPMESPRVIDNHYFAPLPVAENSVSIPDSPPDASDNLFGMDTSAPSSSLGEVVQLLNYLQSAQAPWISTTLLPMVRKFVTRHWASPPVNSLG